MNATLVSHRALRLLAIALAAFAFAVFGGLNRSIAQEIKMNAPAAVAIERSGRNDFDFLVGEWQVANRRLKQRHVGSKDWDEFPATISARFILGGLGNVDELFMPTKGWAGVTLRLYDPAKRLWSIYWVNSRDGIMQPPVVGAFRNGVGEFFADDTDEGRAIRVRFRWTVIDRNTAHWEQAFSTDNETTWETNWTSDLKRTKG